MNLTSFSPLQGCSILFQILNLILLLSGHYLDFNLWTIAALSGLIICLILSAKMRRTDFRFGLLILSLVFYHLLSPLTWHGILLPIGLLSFYVLRLDPFIWGGSLFLFLLQESVFLFNGTQTPLTGSLNMVVTSGLVLILFYYKKGNFKRRVAPNIIIGDRQPIINTSEQREPIPVSRETGHQFNESMKSILELAHSQLHLTSAVLLWPQSQGFRIRTAVSSRASLQSSVMPINAGIISGLQQDREFVSMAPVRTEAHLLPYYSDQRDVGGIFAIRIPFSSDSYAIFCVDRPDTSPWNEEERAFLTSLSKRITSDLTLERRITALSLDHDRLLQVSKVLSDLNSVLGLDSVYEATRNAVASFIPLDSFSISLKDDSKHRLVYTTDHQFKDNVGSLFSLDEGLVGQVIRSNHWLPASQSYQAPVPLFTNKQKTEGINSLLLLPLRGEQGDPIGVLSMGAKQKNIFTKSRREILNLISNQVGIKIDLAQAHEKISRLATTDGLTGLANHRTFQHAFNMMLERTHRNQCPLCLIFCDIDHFKNINDTYGHPFGDQVLKEVARILSTAVRKIDLAARYGGEEFALVLEAADEKGGKQFAERIRRDIENCIILHGREPVQVTISMGLSFCPLDADEKEMLIARADQALYKAKSQGRNRVVAWSDAQGSRGGNPG